MTTIDDIQKMHKDIMPYLWTVVIDVGILFAMNQYRVTCIILHELIGMFVCLTTLAISFPLYFQKGIPEVENQYYSKRHNTIGLVIIIIIFFQVVSGMVSVFCKLFIKTTHPYIIFFLNVFHKYLGYPLIILAKVQTYLYIWPYNKTKFWILLGIEIFLFLLWLAHKLLFPTLSKTIIPKVSAIGIQKVQKLQDVKTQSKNLGIFANYVYDITPLKIAHPQGYRIIDSIKNRDFDRYIYGMYATEREPFIQPHAHSFRAFDMLEEPIAKIQIPKLYQGLDENHNEFFISSTNLVSEQTKIYQIFLKKQIGEVKFNGYSSLSQIGRYFSLTINDSITRLYTTVGFLQKQIKKPSHKIILPPLQLKVNSSNVKLETTEQQMIIKKDRQLQIINNGLHLLIKIYPDGKLTPQLLNNPKSIKLSQERGEGLSLQNISPGKLIIVAGGTGLFPFSDLIDLLHKSELLRKKDPFSRQILQKNPILESNPFVKFTFHLFLAVQHINDIHPLTAKQLAQLSQNPQFFKITIKIKSMKQGSPLNSKEVKLTQKRFDELVGDEMRLQSYKKIFVCGPPLMQEAMMKMFDTRNIDRADYLFV